MTHTPRTADELRRLAVDIAQGRVFTSMSIPENQRSDLLHLIFMPLVFASKETLRHMEDGHVLFEYMSEAGPRSINGYPIFFSCGMLNRTETEIVWRIMREYDKQEKRFFDPPKSCAKARHAPDQTTLFSDEEDS